MLLGIVLLNVCLCVSLVSVRDVEVKHPSLLTVKKKNHRNAQNKVWKRQSLVSKNTVKFRSFGLRFSATLVVQTIYGVDTFLFICYNHK